MVDLDEFNWNQPFCVVRPSAKLKPFPNATITASSGGVLLAIKTLITNKIDKTVQSITSNGKVRYVGRQESQLLQDIQNSNIQTSLQYESSNVHCYKLARRRKYAQRNIVYYMPLTFVGALFECQTSPELKQQILSNFSQSDYFSFKSFDFKCDNTLSTPLKPIVAEDATTQYFTRVSTAIIQNIPYLTTATPFDLRFSLSESSDMTRESWGSDIDVNEEYTYNPIELNMMLIAFAKVTNYMNDLINIKPTFKILKYFSLRPHEHDNDDVDYQKLPLDQKLAFLLNQNRSQSINILQHLQNLWDETDL